MSQPQSKKYKHLLKVDSLSIANEVSPLIKNVSFYIDDGESVGLVGPSGVGKSTLALALLDLLPSSFIRLSGEIEFSGTPMTKELFKLRGNGISLIFQQPTSCLNPVLSIGSQLMDIFAAHYTASIDSAKVQIRDILQKVGFQDIKSTLASYAHQLSGGMAQLVMISMALLCRPQLLIADEPTSALDIITQQKVLNQIKRLQAEYGFAFLLISHDLPMISQFTDRVLELRDGNLGPPDRGSSS